MSANHPIEPESTLPPPPPAYRWVVLVIISLAMFGNYYVYDAVSPIADLLQDQLGFSDSNIGLLERDLQRSQHLHGAHRRHHHRPDRRQEGDAAVRRAVSRRRGDHGRDGATRHHGRRPPGLRHRRRVADRLGHLRHRQVVQGQGAELRVRCQPDHRPAGLLRGAQLADVGASGAFENWQWPLLITVAFGTFCVVAPLVYWAMENRAARRYQRRRGGQQRTRSSSPTSSGSATSFWYVVLLCVTFYSAIFPVPDLRGEVLHRGPWGARESSAAFCPAC